MRDSVPGARYSSFVIYCANGKPRSSLFIESTDSMIRYIQSMNEIIITKSSNSASNCYDDPIPVCHIEGRCLQKARIYRQD